MSPPPPKITLNHCIHRKSKSSQQKMKDKQFLNDEEEEDNPSRAIFYWWRSSAKFDECVNNKFDLPNLSKTTSTCKVFREMERLASIASEGLYELRHKLLSYRSGDLWVPIGGMKKEDMDIPAVNTILLVGFGHAGKSSLVNLMYSVLGRSGLIPFAQTSSGSISTTDTSLLMEEHNVLRSSRNGFCVYDSRGFDYDHVDEALGELSEWMMYGVRHNQLCLRPGDNVPSIDELELHSSRSCTQYANRRVNCVMVVVNVAEINKAIEVGDKKPVEALKQLFHLPALRRSNENPVLILTHGDKLSTEDRIDIRLKICESLGVSGTNGTYDIVCTTEYGFLPDEIDPITAYAVSEAVYRALMISDRGHLPKRKFQDWALLALSCLMCCIAQLFMFLGHLFSRSSPKEKLKW